MTATQERARTAGRRLVAFAAAALLSAPSAFAATSPVVPAVPAVGTPPIATRAGAALAVAGVAPAAAQPLAVAPPAVGDPLPAASPVYQAAAGGREAGDVAAGADGYLAVWEDFRTYDLDHSEIYAARIAPDGTVLDPAGIRVTSTSGQQSDPQVAWNGTEYLVVWTDFDDPYRSTGDDIYGARIAADGTVIDSPATPIGNSIVDEGQPDVAWNGSAWVVAWTAFVSNGSDIRVERLDTDLHTIGPDDLSFAASSYAQTDVSLAVEGTTTWAIYTDARDSDTGDGLNVYMNFLTADGQMQDDGFPIVTGPLDQLAGGIAASPSGVLATWTSQEDDPPLLEPVVRARRFQDGVPSGAAVVIAPAGRSPRVAWGSDGYLVAWDDRVDDEADVMARTVSIQVELGDPYPVTTGDASENVAAVAGGADDLVLATEKPSYGGAGTAVLAVRTVHGDVFDNPPISLGMAAPTQWDPAIVDIGGGSFAVAWSELHPDTGWDIRFGRLTAAGALVDGPGSTVAGSAADEMDPSIGWDGTHVLVSWWDDVDPGGRMVVRAFDPDGTAAGAATVLGTGITQHAAAISSNGPGFAVAWAKLIVGANNELWIRRFASDGTPGAAATSIAAQAYGASASLAPLGTGFVTAWNDMGRGIAARRFDAAASPIDAQPIQVTSPGNGVFDDQAAVASSGSRALVTWISGPGNATPLQVQAARVDASGAVLDTTPIDISPVLATVQGARVAWNGRTWLATWWAPIGQALSGTEINPLGEIVTGARTLATIPNHGGVAWPASSTNGRMAVATSSLHLGNAAGGVDRVDVRFIDVARPPVTASSVAIAAGAAATRAAAVHVSVPAAGAVLVALSNDGTTWTTRTYATTQAWTLPGGDGVKTVRVRWRDATGAWSSTKTDTITLDTVRPSASAPGWAHLHRALDKGRVAVRVSWAAADDRSGVAASEVGLQVDGGRWTRHATTSGRLADLLLSPGHTYRLRVRAIDRAGNVGPWMTGASFRLRSVSQASSLVHYAGVWSTASGPAWWGGTTRWSSRPGAIASFTATGRSMAWVGAVGPGRGRAIVSINGVDVATVDLSSPVTRTQVVVWSAGWSNSATRTITIRVLGTSGRPRVDLDGFVVGS